MAGPRTDNTGQIVRRSNGEPEVITLLSKMKGEIARALPKHITAERMSRVALTALRATPALLECSTASLLGSIMSAAQLGLEVNTPLGFAYLVPYKRVCQLIIGYQGYLDLSRRSRLVSIQPPTLVREGDDYEVTYGVYQNIVHKPSRDPEREARPWTHVYAVAHAIPKDAAPPIFVELTRAQVMKRKARSATANSSYSPWRTDEDAMALKTAIRAIWPWVPKTSEMAVAASFDDHAERGTAQVESWSSDFVDAMKREGVVVDSPEVTPMPDRADPEPLEQDEPVADA
jgi:recombination protein RecT